MNKKVLGLAVLFAILCIGFILLRPASQQKPEEKKVSFDSPSLKSEIKEPIPAHVKSSLFNSLTPNVLVAFTIFPNKYSYVADHFTKLKTKLSQTKLWKENNGDALLKSAENEVKVSASESAPKNLPSSDFAKILQENWRSVSEITFALLDDSKDITEGFFIPKTLVEVHTQSAALLAEFKSFIKVNTPLSVTKSGVSRKLEQSPNNENQYVFTISSEDSKISAKGSLTFEASKVSLLVNADSLSEFIAKDPSITLINSSKWNSSAQNYHKETFSLYAIQYEKLIAMTQKILSLVHEESDITKPNLSSDLYKGMYELSGDVNFKDGLNISQCLNFDPGSFTGKHYSQFFNKSKSILNQNKFSQLISKNTVFGLNLSAAYINLFTMFTLGNFSENAITEAAKEPEIKKIIDALSKRKELFTDFPFDHTYFLLNTPQGGGFVPDSYILLQGPQKNAPLLLSEVKSLVEEIYPDFAQLILTKDPNGKDVLQMKIDENYKVFAKYLPDGSIVITHSEVIVDSIQKRLSSTKNYSDLMTISGKSAKEIFSKSEFSTYIANKPIFEFGKPFLGLLTMSAPEIKMTPADLDEALKPLEFALVSTSESSQLNNSTFCSSSHSVLADIQQQDENL